MGKVINEELLQKYSPETTETREFHTKVVGTTFRVKAEVDAVETGDFVLLDPEVGNPKDAFAVRVVHDKTEKHIGYISAQNGLAKEIWENSVKNGHLYVARVTVTGGGEKNRGLNLLVKHLIPQNSLVG